MIRTSIRLLAVAAVVTAILPPGLAAAPRDPAASRQVYNDIHARLDPGGDLMVIANVDGLLEKALATASEFAAIAPVSAVGSELSPADMLAKVSLFLKRNGFYAVKGVGISIVPRADGMSDIKTFVAREAAAVRLPLWQALVGGAPSAMKCHAYLPKDTVLVRSGTADLRALWQLVQSGITEFGGDEAAAGFNMGMGMFAAQAGVSADALIQSIAPEGLLSVQFAADSTVQYPIDDETMVTIPAPSLLLVTAVNDSTIIDTIKRAFVQNLQMPLPEVKLGDAVVYTVPIPVPSPIPFQLTLATHGNYLLIGTTSAVVTDALNAASSGGGLKTVPEFANAFPGTTPNNGIQFVSRRFGETLKRVRDQMLGQLPPGSEEAQAFNVFRNWMDQNLETGAAFTIHNLRTGVQISGVSASGGQQAVGAMFAAPAGMMAAIAIPSFVKAREQAKSAHCINNLRQIDAAKEQWAMVENKTDGDPVDETGIFPYIKGSTLPACPQGGTYTLGPIGVEPTCSHPGHSLR